MPGGYRSAPAFKDHRLTFAPSVSMRTIKPQRLGLLSRVFENEGHCYFVVSVFGLFAFEQPNRLLSEVALWKLVGQELGDGAILDEGMSKQRGELLMTAKDYPSRPGSACKVRVELGPIDKSLYVVGDRSWDGDDPSLPEPFSEMPIDYAHAFGGAGYERNPEGKGYDETEVGRKGNCFKV